MPSTLTPKRLAELRQMAYELPGSAGDMLSVEMAERLERAISDLLGAIDERDAERLDALDCFCRRIAFHAVAGVEPRTDVVFRWQIDHHGPQAHRPSIRDAIDAAIGANDMVDPCPKGDPDCETGDDGSCHDACEG